MTNPIAAPMTVELSKDEHGDGVEKAIDARLDLTYVLVKLTPQCSRSELMRCRHVMLCCLYYDWHAQFYERHDYAAGVLLLTIAADIDGGSK